MRLYNKNVNPAAHGNLAKMLAVGAVAHSCRHDPGNIKSPTLTGGTRAAPSWHHHHQQHQQQHHQQQQHVGSRHSLECDVDGCVSGRGSCLDNQMSCQSVPGNSCQSVPGDSCQSAPRDSCQCPRDVVRAGSKLLVHHQRHSFKNRFRLLGALGQGSYGKVRLAVDKGTGTHVAVKNIKKTKMEDDQTRIRREIQILSRLNHKHIVNIREVFERKEKIVLVLDYASGGELYDYLDKIGPLTECEARRIFRQIVSAIQYCHQNGVVHRDLKLENIILDHEGNVKVADFGLSNFYSNNRTLSTFCGSPLYASPEIVNGTPYHGPEVDVWSLGIILFTLVYGSMPFESNNVAILKQLISHGLYSQPAQLSDAAGLIRHMLTVTTTRRASMAEVLRHWWVNFGYSHMPDDMPYNLEQEPPITAPRRSPTSSSPRVANHRNYDSISSDSDVELDFRSDSWRQTREACKISGLNSVSVSASGSHTSLNCPRDCADQTTDTIMALNLPPDVLDTLQCCSRKTLADLITSHQMSSAFDETINDNNDKRNGTKSGVEPSNLGLVSLSICATDKKPKRGILKRKGKFSGGDSGCVMPEDMTSKFESMTVPEYSHPPHMTSSGETNVHETEHQACQLVENDTYCRNHGHCSAATFGSVGSKQSDESLGQPHHHQHLHHQHLHQPAITRNLQDVEYVHECSKNDTSFHNQHLNLKHKSVLTKHELVPAKQNFESYARNPATLTTAGLSLNSLSRDDPAEREDGPRRFPKNPTTTSAIERLKALAVSYAILDETCDDDKTCPFYQTRTTSVSKLRGQDK